MLSFDKFLFSPLPDLLKIEILRKLDTRDSHKILQVQKGLRNWMLKNGPFCGNIFSIIFSTTLCFELFIEPNSEQQIVHRFQLDVSKSEETHSNDSFDFIAIKALFKDLKSCKDFSIFARIEFDDGDSHSSIVDDEIANGKIAETFPNLKYVSNLEIRCDNYRFFKKIWRNFKFNVLDLAMLKFGSTPFQIDEETADFVSAFFEKHLKNCDSITIFDRYNEFYFETLQKTNAGFILFPQEFAEGLSRFDQVETQLRLVASRGVPSQKAAAEFCFHWKYSQDGDSKVLQEMLENIYGMKIFPEREETLQNEALPTRIFNYSREIDGRILCDIRLLVKNQPDSLFLIATNKRV
ncbi:unnamed protein product, partial [Mesorhabditis belari]|uniref:F-box domain-containing protein n=1 Tax=Mesorhabditis belari TaxID=2138241 RepID=A0AAF3EV19_9BILA